MILTKITTKWTWWVKLEFLLNTHSLWIWCVALVFDLSHMFLHIWSRCRYFTFCMGAFNVKPCYFNRCRTLYSISFLRYARPLMKRMMSGWFLLKEVPKMLLGSLCKQPLKHALQPQTNLGSWLLSCRRDLFGSIVSSSWLPWVSLVIEFLWCLIPQAVSPVLFLKILQNFILCTKDEIWHFDRTLKPSPYLPHKDSLQCCQLA